MSTLMPIASAGFSDQSANYGKYSGAPTEIQTFITLVPCLISCYELPCTLKAKFCSLDVALLILPLEAGILF